MTPRPDVSWIRRGLERVLSPASATGVIFEALERWEGPEPQGADAVLALIRGPLVEVLHERIGVDRARTVTRSLEAELRGEPPSEELVLELDIPDEIEEEEQPPTVQMMAVAQPVSVLVVGANEDFGRKLSTVLGKERVQVETVSDEWQLRHAVFAGTPLLVVVDGLAPPAIRPPELADALERVPADTVPVLWGDDTDYGRAMRTYGVGERVVSLPRKEGIEPLLDLILSRQRQTSIHPIA